MSATTAYEVVQNDIDRIVNSDPHDLSTMEVGDEWRQGDVRIIRLPDDFDLASHCTPIDATDELQLAPGNTQGSRHCVDGGGVKSYVLKKATPLDGPILKLSQPKTITHPEHGHCCNLPEGIYAFPGQRSFAEELRRAQD